MENESNDGILHIHLTEDAERTLDVFNRAQAGEMEPFAKYLEDGGKITEDMRFFLAAHLRGLLNFKKGNRRTLALLKRDHGRLWQLRDLIRDEGLSEYKATVVLAEKLGESESNLRAQIRKAKQEEAQGEIQIGPPYRL